MCSYCQHTSGLARQSKLFRQFLKHKDYGIKLEVDTTAAPIEAVIGQLLARYAIADITVDNPPMEEIIGRIYEVGPGGTPELGGK